MKWCISCLSHACSTLKTQICQWLIYENVTKFFTFCSVCVLINACHMSWKTPLHRWNRDQEQDQHQNPDSGNFATCSLKFCLDLHYMIYSLFSFSCCSRGGVLDNHSGPVSERQCHVHSMSELGHSSWSGSQHQVHWCMIRTLTYWDYWILLQLWLHCYRLANGSASLIAVGNTSRSEFVKHLKRYSSSSGQVRSIAWSFRTKWKQCHLPKRNFSYNLTVLRVLNLNFWQMI